MSDKKITEEVREEYQSNEAALLKGLLEELKADEQETFRIEIVRNGKLRLAFDIRPLSEAEFNKCRERHTKYKKVKRFGGIPMPERTDQVAYRSDMIVTATTDEYREKLWNNKEMLAAAGVVSAGDLVDKVLRGGEKDMVVTKIQEISGYTDDDEDEDNDTLVDTAKN